MLLRTRVSKEANDHTNLLGTLKGNALFKAKGLEGVEALQGCAHFAVLPLANEYKEKGSGKNKP